MPPHTAQGLCVFRVIKYLTPGMGLAQFRKEKGGIQEKIKIDIMHEFYSLVL